MQSAANSQVQLFLQEEWKVITDMEVREYSAFTYEELGFTSQDAAKVWNKALEKFSPTLKEMQDRNELSVPRLDENVGEVLARCGRETAAVFPVKK